MKNMKNIDEALFNSAQYCKVLTAAKTSYQNQKIETTMGSNYGILNFLQTYSPTFLQSTLLHL
jgi:hypothetical protein